MSRATDEDRSALPHQHDGSGTGNALPDMIAALIVPQASAPAARQGATDGPGASAAPAAHRYEIRNRPEPPPVPNGWYAACFSADLGPGQIETVIAVERELVVYRDESGAAHVVDAHCPHLGAHLGGGMVVEDTIKCPYHGWRFGPDGVCTEIAYHDGHIPQKACLSTYRVREQDGFVLFWFHHGNKPPTYEVPPVPQVHTDEWTAAVAYRRELTAALPEMAENNVDYAHLRYVHRRPVVPVETSSFTTDGPRSTVVEQLPEGGSFSRTAHGPGVAHLVVPDLVTLLACTTPIDRRHSRVLWHFHFASSMASYADALLDGFVGQYGLEADLPIWRDKVYLDHPVLVKADGHLAQFRAWYTQFYEDAELP
jgi:phenylpropionate dioxygenase-like ring-hydroxylating dioxygenase large terminal subunit